MITTSGSIGNIDVLGTAAQQRGQDRVRLYGVSRRAGRDAGSQPDRPAARCSGDLINSVSSASFRPANNHYSYATGTAGPGSITAQVTARQFDTGGMTGLGNTGAGLFARRIMRLRIKRLSPAGRRIDAALAR